MNFRTKNFKILFTIIASFLMLNSIALVFLSQPVKGDDLNAIPAASTWSYSGWQYRKAHDLTNNQPSTSINFYSLSSSFATFSGNPNQRHAFQPVHSSNILEVDKVIDGNTWKYLGYDCDPAGSLIRLYYTNNTAGLWIAYSKNPILGPQANYFRWPSVTYIGGTFYMFLENYSGGTLERWSSTDGINYVFVETVKSGGNQYKNPFIWLNPNDNRWYLYYHDSSGNAESFKVRSATSVIGLRTATETTLLTRNLPFGSPTIMFYGGRYWLLGEILPGSQWQVVAYYSTSPTSGFVEASNSPILTNDEACPMVYLDASQTTAFLFTTATSGTWNEETRQINLNSAVTSPSSDLSNYQIRIVVNYGSGTSSADSVYLGGHGQPDFRDIHFTWFNSSSSSEIQCSYWIEQLTQSSYAIFWIKIPQISGSSNSTMYIYYGNSNAPSTSNGAATFEFFDDFSGDLSKWTPVGGTWQIQSGQLVAQTNTYGQRLRANNFVFGNNSVHVKVEWVSGTYFENGPSIRGQSPNEQNNEYMSLVSAWAYDNRDRISKVSNGAETTLASQGSTNPSQNVWYTCVFSAYGNTLKSSVSPLYPTTITVTDDTFRTGTLCLFDWSASAETVYYDNVFVTKYSSPEPIQGTWFSEETGQTPPPTSSVTIDSSFVSDARADVGTTQTIGFHAQWSNGSSINSGSIYINGTQNAINSAGWTSFTSTYSSPAVYKEASINMPIQASWIADDGTLYAGSLQTLYKSLDQGLTWKPLITFNSSNPVQIGSVYVSKNNYVYISPNETAATSDLGLWRSVDGGQTWLHILSLPPNCSIWPMDEDSNGNLFVGVYTYGSSASNARIYKSTNNGTTWDSVYYDASARHIHSISVDTNNNYVYAAVGDVLSPWNIEYIIRSTLDGNSNTWSQILSGLPQITSIVAIQGARLFATDSSNGQIYRTIDDLSYTSVLNTGALCYGFWMKSDNLNGNIYASFVTNEFSTYSAIYVSSNHGVTWNLYKTFSIHSYGGYLGSETASNFVQGIMYYSVNLDSGYQNGIKFYPTLDVSPHRSVWLVTGVNCSEITSFTQTASNQSVIWDQIKILNGGVTKSSGNLGDNAIVWFTACYQYDNTAFDNTKGTLYVNSSAMLWSSVNSRWEYPYTANMVGTTALKVSNVLDNQFGLTLISDVVNPVNFAVLDQPFCIVTNSTLTQLAFNSTSKTLTFTVSGPSGSTGFTNLTVAKSLMQNLTNLNVYLDRNPLNYTSASTNYYWNIQFTYQHSTHEVVVSYGSISATANLQVTKPTAASPNSATTLLIATSVVLFASILLVTAHRLHKIQKQNLIK